MDFEYTPDQLALRKAVREFAEAEIAPHVMEWDEAQMPAYNPARYGGVAAGGIDPARVDAITTRLMAAEHPIALTAYSYRVEQLKSEGAPIEIAYLPPVVAFPTGIGMFRRAQHPHAAMLFQDFILTDGQKIISEREAIPTNPKVKAPPDGMIFVGERLYVTGSVGDRIAVVASDGRIIEHIDTGPGSDVARRRAVAPRLDPVAGDHRWSRATSLRFDALPSPASA